MDGDASPNDISSKSMISLGHINTDDGHGDRPAVKRDPFLVQAQGGKVQTNKETAMVAFLKLKLRRGESLSSEQLAIVNATLNKETLASTIQEAQDEAAAGCSKTHRSAGGKRKRGPLLKAGTLQTGRQKVRMRKRRRVCRYSAPQLTSGRRVLLAGRLVRKFRRNLKT